MLKFGFLSKLRKKPIQTPQNEEKKYLKISNKGTVDREFLELIGATTKRGQNSDSSIIGNKGSGAKFSVIPILRLGLEIVISSSDQQGAYFLKYKTEQSRIGGLRVIFDFGKEIHPSQFTLDALQDWDKPIGADDKKIFKALREFICNAYDADKEFRTEIVEKITPAQNGETVVYLSMTAEIEEILKNSKRYFKFLNKEEPLLTTRYGVIYSKSDTMSRLFLQGVLVDCKEFNQSIFDYSLLDKFLLSEERIIRDFSRFIVEIGRIIASVDDCKIALKILESFMDGKMTIETEALDRIGFVNFKTREAFREAWQLHYGEKAAMAVLDTAVDEDVKQIMGYKIVLVLDPCVRGFLKKCGILETSDLVPKQEKKEYEIVELTTQQRAIFDRAYALFVRVFPETKYYPVIFYKPLIDFYERTGGFAKNFREVWINADYIISVRECIKTLEHETRHIQTKAGDYDRRFDEAASERLIRLVMASVKDDAYDAKIVNQGIVLPRRFVGKEAHILIDNDELRIKIRGENVIFQTRLATPITGHLSQVRKVKKFSGQGCVFVPTSIQKQLATQLQLEIIR